MSPVSWRESSRRTAVRTAVRLAVAFLVVAFVAVGAATLGRAPISHVDEAWLAAPGYGFVTTGRFASPVFTGFFGMERHYYGFMPLFPILVGASLRVFGHGLVQARLVPLALASLVLLLVHALGRRLLSEAEAGVAVAILALWPLTVPPHPLTTGIPWFDQACLVRNDVAVAAFGLAMLLVLLPALEPEAPHRDRRLAWAGIFGGLTVLAHVYGAAFLAPAVLALFTRERRRIRAPLLFLSFAGLTLVPYLLFVASGWRDYLDQNFNYASRVTLFTPRFYAWNFIHEFERYRFLLARARYGGFAAWLFLLALAAGLAVLQRSARRGAAGPRILLTALLAVAGLFALFLAPKNFSYLAPLWPLSALVASSGLVGAWRASGSAVRTLLVVAVLAASGEGVVTYCRHLRSASQTTAYADFAARLGSRLPPGSRILAMHHYWFGLGQNFPEFRSLFVPISLTNPRFTKSPLPFEASVDALAPDLFLLDQSLLDFLREAADPRHAFHPLAEEIRSYVARRGRLVETLQDVSYGRMEIYAVGKGSRSAGSALTTAASSAPGHSSRASRAAADRNP